MLLTLTLILIATTALAVVELWLFWQLGERRDSRRIHKRRAARPMENRAEIELTRPRQPKSRLVNRAV